MMQKLRTTEQNFENDSEEEASNIYRSTSRLGAQTSVVDDDSCTRIWAPIEWLQLTPGCKKVSEERWKSFGTDTYVFCY